tara:strand:+ start:1201 stop:1596 length:396 start_codon:yes stop_codon:yes gene_type:complete
LIAIKKLNTYKNTKSVKLIINTFKIKNALTINELVDRFKSKMNKSTVYRILERLEKSGKLHSFLDQKGIRRYAKNDKKLNSSGKGSKHSHFLCEDCGISLCISLDLKIPKASNYIINSSEHLLTGQCNDCL